MRLSFAEIGCSVVRFVIIISIIGVLPVLKAQQNLAVNVQNLFF